MAQLRIDGGSGRVNVVAEPGAGFSASGGVVHLAADGTAYVKAKSKTLDITCAPGTDLTIGTSSGSVHVTGPIADARIASSSGSIAVDEAEAVDARTKSGQVSIGRCAGECRVMVKSGNVRVGRAGHASVATVSGTINIEAADSADVKNVSGTINLGVSSYGSVKVRNVSGAVEITVPSDREPATRLESVSGRISCEAPAGTDGEIDVKTVSGTIRIACR